LAIVRFAFESGHMRRKHLRAKSGHLSEKPKRDGFYKHTPNYITAAATMTAASTSAPVGTFILNCRALSDLCVARKSKAHRYSLYNAFIADTSFPNRIHMRRYTDFDQIASAAAERRMSEVCAMQASKWEFDNATNDDADDALSPPEEFSDRFGIKAALIGLVAHRRYLVCAQSEFREMQCD